MTKYLFIDGAFLQKYLQEIKERIEPEAGSLSIDYSLIGQHYDRTFYYDAYPERENFEDEEKYKTEREYKDQLFSKLSAIDNFHVRPALTRRSKKKREQKGVDVLLAIECLTHALRGNIDVATIMTSDLDFYPLFEALINTRTKSQLIYQPGITSPDLPRAADLAFPMNLDLFLSWLRDARAMRNAVKYQVGELDRADVEEIKTGTIKGERFNLVKDLKREMYVFVTKGQVVHYGRKFQCLAEIQFEEMMGGKIVYT